MKFNGIEIDDKLKGKLISEYLNSASRIKLAEAMVAPIRRKLDYTGIARKAFSHEPVFKYHCKECGMQWNEDDYIHSSEDCTVYSVQES